MISFKRLVLWGVLVSVLCTGCGGNDTSESTTAKKPPSEGYHRIISMAPNITETLYALGQEDRVAGVTSFCVFPPEVENKPRIGGLLDPNYEAIVALRPDLVLLLPEHETVKGYLDKLDIMHVTVYNRTVDEILATIETIGELCNAVDAADSVRADIEQRIEAIARRTSSRLAPTVLVCISRNIGIGELDDVYVAGEGTFYETLIGYAGGMNAYTGGGGAYPLVSAEGLLHLDPDIIVDLATGLDPQTLDREKIIAEWDDLDGITAVKNDRVHLVTADYAVVPGPRFILLLEDLASIIHPETMP